MIVHNGNIVVNNGRWIIPPIPPKPDPYNPLNLPPNTVRVRTVDGEPPIKVNYTSYETATLVAGTTDVYDVYKSGTSFMELLYKSTNVIEVLGANTSNITYMLRMFCGCTALQSVPLFDTSNVTSTYGMFQDCTSLTNVPLLDTSKVTTMENMFRECWALQSVPLFNTSNVVNMAVMFADCYNVQSGALALYQQAISQATPPRYHTGTFANCGSNTQSGAAELAQIPANWK